MLRESISKLDKFREALSTKKRQRSDLSIDRGGGVNLTKMGSQLHRNSNDILPQKSEAKTSSSPLNKRIRTSVADVRVCIFNMLLFTMRRYLSFMLLWFWTYLFCARSYIHSRVLFSKLFRPLGG